MTDITMPQLGETVTEGTVIRWLKGIGDHVRMDEALFEVSTDKVDSEVPSPVDGFLAEVLVVEGTTVPVGTRLAVLSDVPTANPPAAVTPPPAPAPAPVVAPPPAPAPAPAPVVAPPPAPAPVPAPAVTPPPAPAPVDPVTATPGPSFTNGPGEDWARTLVSPVVRRLMTEHRIDPAAVRGTGLGGRITRDDVEQFIAAKKGAPVGSPSPTPAVAPPPAPPQPPAPAPRPAPAAVGGGNDEIIPFDNMRRRTAAHMVASKATSPHALVAKEIDFEPIEKVRRRLGADFKAAEGFSLTYLPFVVSAVGEALRAFPKLNSSVGEDSLVVHRDLNIGVAVDLDFQGLIVPVIRAVDDKRLRALAREIRSAASRARSRQLMPDDISGGTFTVTNPGPFGTFLTYPIINQPQVAILSTDGIKRRPVVVTAADGSEAIAIHSVGLVALSFDHRAVDGAYAAAFLAKLEEVVTTRDWQREL